MPNISRIEILPGLAQKHYWKGEDELDVLGAPQKCDPQAAATYQIFDGVQKEQTPAVIVNTPIDESSSKPLPCLSVTVSNIDAALVDSNKWCHIEVFCAEPSKFRLVSDSFQLQDSALGTGSTDKTFPVQLESSDKAAPNQRPEVPVAFWQNFRWHFVVDATSDVMMDSVLLELYILPNKLPDYFTGPKADGVPRLLCRMFVDTATRVGVDTTEDWVAHVTAICHGSREPFFTANQKSTEDHWLKYDVWSGNCSFVSGSPYNQGGSFRLKAWLDAYRNFKKSGALTLVNCYDQAAAVEVALSIGMDYNWITWQFHQVFGYIHKSAQLVGWGLCNHPYFGKNAKATGGKSGYFGDSTNKIMESLDPERSGFKNHAFLSWQRRFDPKVFKEADKDTNYGWPDPTSIPAMENLKAIDACAGPHLGNEPVGAYTQPELSPTPRDPTPKDYWSGRDPDFYPKGRPNTCIYSAYSTKELFDDPKGKADMPPGQGIHYYARHYLTTGITGIADDGPRYPDSPWKFNVDWTHIIPPANASGTFGGQLSQALDNFSSSISQFWSTAKRIPIADVDDGNGRITSEAKVYASDEQQKPMLNFYSLRLTLCADSDGAIEQLKSRVAHVALSSKVTLGEFTAQAGNFNMLTSDYDCLFVYKNLMVEITGVPRGGDKSLAEVASVAYGDIQALG